MKSFTTFLFVFVAAFGLGGNSFAEEQKPESPTLPEVVVTGEREKGDKSKTDVTSDLSVAPAPVTVLESSDIARMPILSYGGYGIAIRGFTDLEHGRDVAYFIDGVPLNEVSSIHTPNYADLNVLIPETVERVEIIRGPFSALYGDSNLGGAVNIVTKRYDSTGSITGSGGSYGTGRGLFTYGQARNDAMPIKPYLAFEGSTTDGYRQNEGFRRYNLFNKLTLPTRDGELSLRAQFYGGDWGAPGYISRQMVQAGTLSPKAAVNTSDGGNKELQNVVLDYRVGEKDQALTATGFINHDIFNRFADFGGGQRLQNENRTIYGLTLRKAWTGELIKLPAQLMIGANWRNDSVTAIQYPTLNRMPNGSRVVDLSYNEHGLGEYVQAQLKPVSWLKLTGGGRYDHFWYDIDDRLAATSVPKSQTGVWSPKAGVAVIPVSWMQIFANYGEGFRSPSAVDDLRTSPDLKPLKLRSREVGLTVDPTARVHFLADVWNTTIDNEIFQPAPGLPLQNLGRSRREGYDLEGRYYLHRERQRELSVFVNYTQIRALLLNQTPAVFVPNVPASLVKVGTDFSLPIGGVDSVHRLSGLIYTEFIGKKHLTQDGAITTNPYERISGRVAYTYREQWTGFLDIVWYPSDRLSETAINFGNATGASPADIFVNPQAPVTVILGLSYRFKTS